jgi:hypothetical protein
MAKIPVDFSFVKNAHSRLMFHDVTVQAQRRRWRSIIVRRSSGSARCCCELIEWPFKSGLLSNQNLVRCAHYSSENDSQ